MDAKNTEIDDTEQRDLDPCDDAFFLTPVKEERHLQYIELLKNVLPYIVSDEGKVVLAQVMIALKVEGIIGRDLSQKQRKMVNIISNAILTQPSKKQAALRFAKRLLK
jgi:hypothetical protein